jgi:hypothetical protein
MEPLDRYITLVVKGPLYGLPPSLRCLYGHSPPIIKGAELGTSAIAQQTMYLPVSLGRTVVVSHLRQMLRIS